MKPLTRAEMKQMKGGVIGTPNQSLGGQCTSTCWDSSTGGQPMGDGVATTNCDVDAGACKKTYSNAVKATCVCN